jgi:hypothetical protein
MTVLLDIISTHRKRLNKVTGARQGSIIHCAAKAVHTFAPQRANQGHKCEHTIFTGTPSVLCPKAVSKNRKYR